MSPQLAIVLVVVFVSIALAVGAIASQILRWSTPEQREIKKLRQRTSTGADQRGAHRGCRSLGEAFPAGGAEVTKGDVQASATAHGGRLPEPDVAVLYGAAEAILPFVFAASRWCRFLEMVHRTVCRGHRLHGPGLVARSSDRAPAETGSQRLAGRPGPDDRVYRGWIGHRSSAGQDQ